MKISESKQNMSDAEERIEPVVMKREIISNLAGKPKLNDDNGTEMTVAESLDLSLDAFSINELVSWRK